MLFTQLIKKESIIPKFLMLIKLKYQNLMILNRILDYTLIANIVQKNSNLDLIFPTNVGQGGITFMMLKTRYRELIPGI